jgi:hypothetical protein
MNQTKRTNSTRKDAVAYVTAQPDVSHLPQESLVCQGGLRAGAESDGV